MNSIENLKLQIEIYKTSISKLEHELYKFKLELKEFKDELINKTPTQPKMLSYPFDLLEELDPDSLVDDIEVTVEL